MIRFKKEDGTEYPDIENKQIKDIFVKITDKNKENLITNILTNSAEFGIIPQSEFFDKDITNEGNTDKYIIIKNGDFVYNPRKSKYAPYGPFQIYKGDEIGIVSPLYSCLRKKDEKIKSDYLQWYFQSNAWHKYIYQNGSQGARHDRVIMTADLLMGIPIKVPCLEEQQKIADFLSSVDDVIAASEQEVANLEEQKKGVMQKIFSQEVRFKADDGSDYPEWEEKKLEECCELITKGTTPKEYSENSEINYVRIDSIENGKINLNKCLKIDNEIHLKALARSILKENDILCSIAGALGVTAIVTKEILPANTNQALAILRLKSNENKEFIVKILDSYIMEKYIRACKTVGAQPNLSLAQMNDFVIPYPCLEEQQKIADFLSDFDTAIDFAKQELEQWKELKKGLLQQLFE